MKNVLLESTAHLENISSVAKAISELIDQQSFCLWLEAPMGAGKTTFTNYLLKNIGLPDIIPVTSPTFAYINEYTINSKLYAHLDLYRINDPYFSIEDLGLTGEREFHGLIVEWGERLANVPEIKPSHILKIEILDDDFSQRRYQLIKT